MTPIFETIITFILPPSIIPPPAAPPVGCRWNCRIPAARTVAHTVAPPASTAKKSLHIAHFAALADLVSKTVIRR